MTSELRSWMRNHVGGGGKSRLSFDLGEGHYYYDSYRYRKVMAFTFRNPQHAMLFKLAWGGK